MAIPKLKIDKNPLKVVAGILVCGASIWLFVHRLPHRGYVAVHPDQGRPKTASAEPAPRPAVFRPAVQAATPASPAQRAGKATAATPGATPGASASSIPDEVDVSTMATVESLYPVDHLRDPFVHLGAGRGRARAFSLQDFSIHKLSLRGVMHDAGTDFALFVDNDAGWGFLLRKGRLYDPKKKVMPGVSGFIKGKNVTLTTPDGDVQVFQLGKAEED
jgi:hypothetical protein